MIYVYVKPNKEFKICNDILLKLLKPPYEITDSGDYCHSTFTRHLGDDLKLIPNILDSALFFKTVRRKLSGVIGSYVHDTIYHGTKEVDVGCKKTENTFEWNDLEYHNSKLSGIEIETLQNGLRIHQKSFSERIKFLDPN